MNRLFDFIYLIQPDQGLRTTQMGDERKEDTNEKYKLYDAVMLHSPHHTSFSMSMHFHIDYSIPSIGRQRRRGGERKVLSLGKAFSCYSSSSAVPTTLTIVFVLFCSVLGIQAGFSYTNLYTYPPRESLPLVWIGLGAGAGWGEVWGWALTLVASFSFR